MLFFACCWPCSSLPAVWLCSSLPAVGYALLCLLLAMLFLAPAVGYALLCLLLAMLFLACCWLCSSLPAVGFALDVLLHVLIPAVGYALSFLLHVFVPAVSLGGPPDCNANSLFQLCHWLFSSPCACHPRLFSAYPNSILWVASSKSRSSFAIVLCWSSSLAHRKRARQSDIASSCLLFHHWLFRLWFFLCSFFF